jgi:hypothetical protein
MNLKPTQCCQGFRDSRSEREIAERSLFSASRMLSLGRSGICPQWNVRVSHKILDQAAQR